MSEPQYRVTTAAYDAADRLCRHHKPDDRQIQGIVRVREAATLFIAVLLDECPESPDKSAAIRKAREAMMTANAAIVVPGGGLLPRPQPAPAA